MTKLIRTERRRSHLQVKWTGNTALLKHHFQLYTVGIWGMEQTAKVAVTQWHTYILYTSQVTCTNYISSTSSCCLWLQTWTCQHSSDSQGSKSHQLPLEGWFDGPLKGHYLLLLIIQYLHVNTDSIYQYLIPQRTAGNLGRSSLLFFCECASVGVNYILNSDVILASWGPWTRLGVPLWEIFCQRIWHADFASSSILKYSHTINDCLPSISLVSKQQRLK